VTNLQANLIGGATISFGYLISYLERTQQPFTLINTKKYFNSLSAVLNPLNVMFQVIRYIFKTDVIFLNSSRGGTKFLVPILFVLARLMNRKFVFRPFGGDIKDYTASYGRVQKWIFKNTVLKADIFFLQTKELMQFYEKTASNIIQLPTSRKRALEELQRKDRQYRKRFVFLGFVNEFKGIDHLLEAAKILGDSYTVHIYGPLIQEKYKQLFTGDHENYKGVLKKEEVLKKLSTYDVLVLPTYYEGEGYPGAIIEAYSLGMPIISTKWKAIPEIVQDTKTGFLIAPNSTSALVDAIETFTTENYPELSAQAYNYFLEKFDVDAVTGRAIEQIESLFSKNQSTIKIKS